MRNANFVRIFVWSTQILQNFCKNFARNIVLCTNLAKIAIFLQTCKILVRNAKLARISEEFCKICDSCNLGYLKNDRQSQKCSINADYTKSVLQRLASTKLHRQFEHNVKTMESFSIYVTLFYLVRITVEFLIGFPPNSMKETKTAVVKGKRDNHQDNRSFENKYLLSLCSFHLMLQLALNNYLSVLQQCYYSVTTVFISSQHLVLMLTHFLSTSYSSCSFLLNQSISLSRF